MLLNTEKLKRFNVDLIRTAVKSAENATKNSIASATGLSIATCGNIIEELVKTGEIIETDMAVSTGGRPSRKFAYNKNYMYIAVIYARIEKREKSIHCTVFNMSGESIYENRTGCHEISVEDLESVIEEILKRFENIQVISLGVPGIVHDGVISSCELEKLSHFHMKNHLEKKFGKLLTIENDVNSTALGYNQRIKNRNPESLAYLYYVEDGLSGAGIIVNGRVLKGSTDFAGEISFLPLGIKIEKQIQIQKNPRKFLDLVSRTIHSVNCIINPDCIVVSGRWFTDEKKELLMDLVSRTSPAGQIPRIEFEADIHESYLKGLFITAMHKLSCGFDVLQK